MPRFVLLLHECPHDRPRPTHCDLMLEAGNVLETWALDELPCGWTRFADDLKLADSNVIGVKKLADHRQAYLHYEGPVSGDRGHVRRLDSGTFSLLSEPLSYSLHGQWIRGTIKLVRVSVDAQWQLVFTAK